MLVRPQLYKLGSCAWNHLRVQCRLMPRKTTAREKQSAQRKDIFGENVFHRGFYGVVGPAPAIVTSQELVRLLCPSATSVMVAV